MCEILRRPPIQKAPVRVELTALIIEAMADLMPNRGAHAAVVLHGVGVQVEKGWVKDRRRKIQTVLDRQVHRINGLRSHPPFGSVHRLPEFRERSLIVEQIGPLRISEWIVTQNLQP